MDNLFIATVVNSVAAADTNQLRKSGNAAATVILNARGVACELRVQKLFLFAALGHARHRARKVRLTDALYVR
jgi:hypothetical protein